MKEKSMKAKAEQKRHIQEVLVPKAIRALEAALDEEDIETRDQIRAAIAILDRGGHGPSASLTIEVEAPTAEAIQEAEAEIARLAVIARANRENALIKYGWTCPGCGEVCCLPGEAIPAAETDPTGGDDAEIVDAEIVDEEPVADVVPIKQVLMSPDV